MTQAEYEHTQKVKYLSFESENSHNASGQRHFLAEIIPEISLDAGIADIACGDGVGLRYLRDCGYGGVIGVEFQQEKALRAQNSSGLTVLQQDMHTVAMPPRDVIISSHSLEHAEMPFVVLRRFYAILKPEGVLYLVLPFPDSGPDDAHCGKFALRSDGTDPQAVIQAIELNGFSCQWSRQDSFREPELWGKFRKV